MYKKYTKSTSDVIVRWHSYSHSKVRHKGVGWDTELEESISGGGVSVDHHAGHGSKGIAGDNGGLDVELLNVRPAILQGAAGAREGFFFLFQDIIVVWLS